MTARRPWTLGDTSELKGHSKAKTPVVKVAKAMKRTAGALRQQAFKLGISLGHIPRTVTKAKPATKAKATRSAPRRSRSHSAGASA